MLAELMRTSRRTDCGRIPAAGGSGAPSSPLPRTTLATNGPPTEPRRRSYRAPRRSQAAASPRRSLAELERTALGCATLKLDSDLVEKHATVHATWFGCSVAPLAQ